MSELLNVIEISIEALKFSRETQGVAGNGGFFPSWNGYHALEVILFEHLHIETRIRYDV